MPLTSSSDLPGVAGLRSTVRRAQRTDDEVWSALYDECDVAVITDSNPKPPVTAPLP